jgi:hypothetical protein
MLGAQHNENGGNEHEGNEKGMLAVHCMNNKL